MRGTTFAIPRNIMTTQTPNTKEMTTMTTRYTELCSAKNKAAHAYHNAMSLPLSDEQRRAEASAGLDLSAATRAVKSFEERHPEVVES
jgi:hypothetical protein